MNEIMKRRFKQLVKNEGLDKVEIYFKKFEDFEEYPLFSRNSEIAFLSKLSFDDKNKLLIFKTLEVIDSIVLAKKRYLNKIEADDYFICLTVTDWEDGEIEFGCLTPHVFVSRRKNWLLKHLQLGVHHTKEEMLINNYLSSLGYKNHHALTPKNQDVDSKRVYVMNSNTIGILAANS